MIADEEAHNDEQHATQRSDQNDKYVKAPRPEQLSVRLEGRVAGFLHLVALFPYLFEIMPAEVSGCA